MRILTVIVILRTLVFATGASAGSTIFNKEPLSCWDENEIIKLRARRLFEDVLPAPVAPEKITDKFIRDLVRYFRRSLRSVEAGSDHRAELLKDAMADTFGAHLRNEILPAARLAFYSGNISHKNAILIHELYDEMKEYLNTQGVGWQEPQRLQQWSNITVAKIVIPRKKSIILDPCSNLVLKRDHNLCIHFPTPMLDDKENPTSIALPFKNGGLVSLTAPSSKNRLLKYYTTAAKCILKSSPASCRKADISGLNRDLWNWLKRDVAPHIQDEKLYTAFGGVLKLVAAVQAHRDSKTRRNLYEDIDVECDDITWHPFELAQPVQIDIDWGSIVYILVVVAIAVAFFGCQIILHFICTSKKSNKVNPIFSYTNMNMKGGSLASFLGERISTSLRTLIPSRMFSKAVDTSNQLRGKTKTMSLGSIRTQRVYDLNENTEKLMAIQSGNELSESTSDSEADARKQSDSPPKLETSISELKIDQRKFATGAACSSQVHTGDTYKNNLQLACSTSQDFTEELSERNHSESLCAVSESVSTCSETSTTSKYSREKRKQSPLDQTSGSVTPVKLSASTQINLNSFRSRSDDTK